MKRNYELDELHKWQCMNFAAKAANEYEFKGQPYSYSFATKLQNSICSNLLNSCHS